MSVSYQGFPEIQRRLKAMLTQKELNKLTDKALVKGAKVVSDEIAKNLDANLGNYSTGATVDEMVIGKPVSSQSRRVVRVGWNGEKERYRIVHLNENGYTRDGRFYGTQLGGYKQIEKAIESTKEEYLKVVRKEMAKGL